ncbi:MAG TPA: prepilin-type N-terminal cleavage/methylation domain-containing protein [Pyrinomonadaceae bacterium]|jgi:type II secretory pathway pseudopilin PulG
MKQGTQTQRRRAEAGFSLIELMIALGVTVVIGGMAVTLLTASFNIRNREDRKSDAIADVRRTLNAMTRDIANAGYGLDGTAYPANGIVAADSSNTQIRLLSNADRFTGGPSPNTPTSQDEDVIYQYVSDAATGQNYIVRFDVNSAIAGTTVLANRIDSFVMRYYAGKVTYTVANCDIDPASVRDNDGNAVGEVANLAQTKFIVMSICVQLPQVGRAGAPGFQPATRQQLTSDVELRNADAINF